MAYPLGDVGAIWLRRPCTLALLPVNTLLFSQRTRVRVSPFKCLVEPRGRADARSASPPELALVEEPTAVPVRTRIAVDIAARDRVRPVVMVARRVVAD